MSLLNNNTGVLNLIRLYFSKNLTKHQKKYDFFNCKLPSRYSLSTDASNSKPNINIGTIGHIDHGKTTLTAAITKCLSEKGLAQYVPYDKIDSAPEEKKRGITINLMHVGYQTANRSYAHIDCPGHADFIKNMITGTSQMDAAILVVAATESIMPQTREHIALAQQIGVKHVIVYINKADLADAEMLELVELEIRELLVKHGFSENSPVIIGSALRALQDDHDLKYGRESIVQLMDSLDKFVPVPERDLKSPFLMSIEKSLSVPGRGQVLVGTVTKGTLKKGDLLEIVGNNEVIKTVATELHVFKNAVNECKAGDNCGILTRGLKPNTISRGMMATAPNSVQQTDQFEASVYMLKKDEGGRGKPILKGYSQSLFLKTLTIESMIQFKDDKEMLMHGDYTNLNMLLRKPAVLFPGDRFTIREGHSLTSLTGVVTKLLPKSTLKIPGFNVVKLKPVITKFKADTPTSSKPVKKTK